MHPVWSDVTTLFDQVSVIIAECERIAEMSDVVVQPRKPPDEERQFKHDSELKDLDQMEKKEEVHHASPCLTVPLHATGSHHGIASDSATLKMFACLSSSLSGISQVTSASVFACKIGLWTHVFEGKNVAAEIESNTCITQCSSLACWSELTLGLNHRCEDGGSTPGCA